MSFSKFYSASRYPRFFISLNFTFYSDCQAIF